uniref:Uncharacterized protein n=1 Tax=Arundo donax TaxID=35708 RepID=A0A0A8ZN55_ARUDO
MILETILTLSCAWKIDCYFFKYLMYRSFPCTSLRATD